MAETQTAEAEKSSDLASKVGRTLTFGSKVKDDQPTTEPESKLEQTRVVKSSLAHQGNRSRMHTQNMEGVSKLKPNKHQI